jgi:ribosomal protein S18 acetylase RimI-like enzyme
VDHPGSVQTTPLPDGRALSVGPLRAEDVEQLWIMFVDAVARGDGYPHTPPLTREAFEQVWIRPVTLTVGALVEGRLVGAYYLKPNQPGLGAHIANAGYLVDRTLRGTGIGRLLVADSIERAPLAGFDAVQFNFVFESNPARAMYEELGWRQIGRVPNAVPHPGGGRQDAVIYWRAVGPAVPSGEAVTPLS